MAFTQSPSVRNGPKIPTVCFFNWSAIKKTTLYLIFNFSGIEADHEQPGRANHRGRGENHDERWFVS